MTEKSLQEIIEEQRRIQRERGAKFDKKGWDTNMMHLSYLRELQRTDPEYAARWLQAMTESNRDPEVKAKRAASMPDQSGENNPFYGKQHSSELLAKQSAHMSEKYSGQGNPFYGKQHSETARKKMSKPRTNTANMRGPRQQKTCPHCGHVGAGGNMSRYHFNNCKHAV